MALPLTAGSLPETETITKDGWRKIASNVNICKIHNNYPATQTVWSTYVNVAGAAPSGLSIPKWKVPDDYAQFEDGVTARDVYAYAVGIDAEITVEA